MYTVVMEKNFDFDAAWDAHHSGDDLCLPVPEPVFNPFTAYAAEQDDSEADAYCGEDR